jgi:hypothetical protein
VEVDAIVAWRCFERAAAAGSERAQRALSQLERRLAPAELARARKPADRPAS